jgi:hypothetical protein
VEIFKNGENSVTTSQLEDRKFEFTSFENASSLEICNTIFTFTKA